MLRTIMATVLLFLVCGCTPKNYLEPDTLPPEDVKTALVRTPSPIYRDGKDLIVIKTIDGEAPTFTESTAIVSPGHHTFQLGIELHRDSARSAEQGFVTRIDTSLAFEVLATREYLIDAREDEHGVWAWATDLTTNFVVAGTPPRELPSEERIEPMWKEGK